MQEDIHANFWYGKDEDYLIIINLSENSIRLRFDFIGFLREINACQTTKGVIIYHTYKDMWKTPRSINMDCFNEGVLFLNKSELIIVSFSH
jgi:hypothetical protein